VLRSNATDADFASACALREAVRARCGIHLAVETHARTGDLLPRIELSREGEAGDGYRIEVGREDAQAVASGPAGLRYAVETLAQLVDPGGRMSACRIEDAPAFARRGILLDVSRGKVPTASTLRALVDLCVSLKLNVLMLYVEHVFRFRRHPEIGAGASPLEASVLRELDAYAAARHVELVPCLQSLGHMEHVLRIPRYAHLAESERRWSVAPTEPGTYALLRDLYQEFLPNFRSALFNANCDEPFDLGSGRSAARAAEVGPGGLFLEHVSRVRDLARSLGKRTMIWSDFLHAHTDRIPALPRDLVLLEWGYEAKHDYDRVAGLAQHGLEFWVCPGTSSWNSLFPRLENSVRNVAAWAEAGRAHGAQGLLVTDWGDFGHYNLQGCSWFGYALAAQHAWSGRVDPRRFDRAFARVLFGDRSGAAARAYRELGAPHEVGFSVPNASPIQFLYFDDLDRAWFLQSARRAPVRRTLARLARARARLSAAQGCFAGDTLTHQELLHAADASVLALRKTLAGLDYLDWRADPRRLRTPERRRLARTLRGLAAEQRALGRTLRRLWLARSRPSNFEITRRRLDRSVRSLERAARSLESDRPPAPPETIGRLEPRRILAALRESAGLSRPNRERLGSSGRRSPRPRAERPGAAPDGRSPPGTPSP
jgi:hypothetical protein